MKNTFVLLVRADGSFEDPLEKVLSKFSDFLTLGNPEVVIDVLLKKTFHVVLPDETVVEIGESVLSFCANQTEVVVNAPVMIYKEVPIGEEAPPLQEMVSCGVRVETGREEINQKFVNDVNELIESYLLQEISPSIGVLSKEMNMSLTKFRIEMKKNIGMSPFKYIMGCRMEKAKEYLALCNYKCTEVAYMVGFSDSRYFRKQFKKYFHQSPTEFLESLKD